MGDLGSTHKSIQPWLTQADELSQKANTPHYNRTLNQAWTLFAAFCTLMDLQPCPASTNTILAFLACSPAPTKLHKQVNTPQL
jgi:hypothetical protein